MSVRTAILISGTGSNMAALLDDMAKGSHPAAPAVVIADRPDAPGLERAEARGVPAVTVERKAFPGRAAFEAALGAELARARAELICLAGFMRILTPGFVQRRAGRILNVHPSLLPLFPGLDTHARALEAGVAVHGCTVHEVTAELDAGPILGQAAVPVHADDTAEVLAARVQAAEHRLYPAVLRRVAAGVRARLPLLEVG